MIYSIYDCQTYMKRLAARIFLERRASNTKLLYDLSIDNFS
jgi:hypothetical protein